MSSLNDCFNNILRHLFSVLFLVIFIVSGHANADTQELSDHKINYSSVNTPLKDFLDSIKLQTSWVIHIEDSWLTAPVSLTLKSVSIEEGLKRAFNQLGLNCALTFDIEQNDIQVYIQPSTSFTTNKVEYQHGKRIFVPRHQLTAVPPEKDNPPPPTDEDLSKMKVANTKSVDYLDLSAVPPDAEGQPGMTEREILQLKNSRVQEHIDLSPVPPD